MKHVDIIAVFPPILLQSEETNIVIDVWDKNTTVLHKNATDLEHEIVKLFAEIKGFILFIIFIKLSYWDILYAYMWPFLTKPVFSQFCAFWDVFIFESCKLCWLFLYQNEDFSWVF